MNVPALTRGTVAASLVVGPALMILSVMLMPDYSGAHAERLEAIAGAQGTATVSAFSFTLFQLFLAVGVVGVMHLLRSRAPVLAAVGGTLVVLGAFGHAVYGGVNLVMLSMAQDLAAVETHAAVLARAEGGLAIPVMAAGMLGTVLGFVLLGVALWRGRLGPRWLGPAMIGWVVVEFGGSALSAWAFYGSAILFAAVFASLAATVWRSSVTHWQTVAEAAHPAAEQVAA